MQRLALAVVFVLLAFAGSASAEKAEVVVTAEIVAIDLEARTIRIEGANAEAGEITIDRHTHVRLGTSVLNLEDLKVGQTVVIDANLHGDELVATYVQVVDAP